MKKKVFFVLSSLRAGGAERVFWLLSQYFDQSRFDVTLVLLDLKKPFFSTDLRGIRVIDLKSVKSSRSFWKLLGLLRREKPDVVYSTAPQVNVLVAFIGLFIPSIKLIGREYCIPDELNNYLSLKGRMVMFLIRVMYRKFDYIICQSDEMRQSLIETYKLDPAKLIVIPNPVLPSTAGKREHSGPRRKIVIVGRLSKEKGHERVINTFSRLPENYHLTIVGGGPLRTQLEQQIEALSLERRIHFTGQLHTVPPVIAEHDLLVLGSFTEGFPNVVLEALSVGTPVVAYKVGGITQVLKNDFNGYIVEQHDEEGFRRAIERACNKKWNAQQIREDAIERFGIQKVTGRYAALIQPSLEAAI